MAPRSPELDQPEAERRAWLDALPPAHHVLLPCLNSVLAGGGDDLDLAPDALAALTPGTADGPGEAGAWDALAPRTGEHVGPYTLERELGRGGMGVVWLAARSDGAYERQVALKLPRAHLTGAAALRRFRRERDILATLGHPHIAQSAAACMSGGRRSSTSCSRRSRPTRRSRMSAGDSRCSHRPSCRRAA